ncbi:MAG: PilZ domain-containing protein [Thermodesulfobacteriota bacterium]
MAAALQVGLELIIQKEVSQERQRAGLVGWSPGEFILIDGPTHWVGMGQLFAQNRLLVRFISLGSFYGFSAKVLTVFKSPLLVVLEWPRHLECMALSNENRYALNTPVGLAGQVAEGQYGPLHPGVLSDISRGGCQVRVKRSPQTTRDFFQGSQARLELILAGRNAPVAVLAQVRNTQRTGTDLIMGMRFLEGQEAALGLAQMYLAPQLRVEEMRANPEGAPEPAPEPARKPAREAPAASAPPPPPPPPPPPAPVAPSPARPAPASPSFEPVPQEQRVDTSANPITLEEMTAERAAGVLGVSALGGSMLAVLKCRELVRAWVEKYGETTMRERRGVLMRECARIQGLELIR